MYGIFLYLCVTHTLTQTQAHSVPEVTPEKNSTHHYPDSSFHARPCRHSHKRGMVRGEVKYTPAKI